MLDMEVMSSSYLSKPNKETSVLDREKSFCMQSKREEAHLSHLQGSQGAMKLDLLIIGFAPKKTLHLSRDIVLFHIEGQHLQFNCFTV